MALLATASHPGSPNLKFVQDPDGSVQAYCEGIGEEGTRFIYFRPGAGFWGTYSPGNLPPQGSGLEVADGHVIVHQE